MFENQGPFLYTDTEKYVYGLLYSGDRYCMWISSSKFYCINKVMCGRQCPEMFIFWSCLINNDLSVKIFNWKWSFIIIFLIDWYKLFSFFSYRSETNLSKGRKPKRNKRKKVSQEKTRGGQKEGTKPTAGKERLTRFDILAFVQQRKFPAEECRKKPLANYQDAKKPCGADKTNKEKRHM